MFSNSAIFSFLFHFTVVSCSFYGFQAHNPQGFAYYIQNRKIAYPVQELPNYNYNPFYGVRPYLCSHYRNTHLNPYENVRQFPSFDTDGEGGHNFHFPPRDVTQFIKTTSSPEISQNVNTGQKNFNGQMHLFIQPSGKSLRVSVNFNKNSTPKMIGTKVINPTQSFTQRYPPYFTISQDEKQVAKDFQAPIIAEGNFNEKVITSTQKFTEKYPPSFTESRDENPEAESFQTIKGNAETTSKSSESTTVQTTDITTSTTTENSSFYTKNNDSVIPENIPAELIDNSTENANDNVTSEIFEVNESVPGNVDISPNESVDDYFQEPENVHDDAPPENGELSAKESVDKYFKKPDNVHDSVTEQPPEKSSKHLTPHNVETSTQDISSFFTENGDENLPPENGHDETVPESVDEYFQESDSDTKDSTEKSDNHLTPHILETSTQDISSFFTEYGDEHLAPENNHDKTVPENIDISPIESVDEYFQEPEIVNDSVIEHSTEKSEEHLTPYILETSTQDISSFFSKSGNENLKSGIGGIHGTAPEIALEESEEDTVHSSENSDENVYDVNLDASQEKSTDNTFNPDVPEEKSSDNNSESYSENMTTIFDTRSSVWESMDEGSSTLRVQGLNDK